YLAGEYRVRLGHRCVGCICTTKEFSVQTRVDGFLHAFTTVGLDTAGIVFAEGDFGYTTGEAGAQVLLQQQPDLTAIFAINDNMALGAYKALHHLKRLIPDDVSVIGF